MKKVIELNNINKNFDNKKVITNVSLNFSEGKIYGLIGRNGAGKSTLLKVIAGLTIPNSGEIKVFDEVVNNYRAEQLRYGGSKKYNMNYLRNVGGAYRRTNIL